MATDADRYLTYAQGWQCGAALRILEPAMAEHEDEQIQTAYIDGWTDGRAAMRAAFEKARAAYGYTPPASDQQGDQR